VSPKLADPSVRVALIEAAARLLAARQPLTTRRLAEEVGTSTMAVYTHFGSMDDLRRAVRIEGFARLTDHLGRVPATDDPVADLVAIGFAYAANAIVNADLYRVMFMEAPLDDADAEAGVATFDPVVDAVARSMGARRFRRGDPDPAAMQLWVITHGLCGGLLAGLFTNEDLATIGPEVTVNLFVGLGDRRASAQASFDAAAAWAMANIPLPAFDVGPAAPV
jgi:AcrR family transcriptional regulator